jgi:thymidylate kinase
MLLSFSGIDGAGKTTQIDVLLRSLAETGSRVLLLSFWDDVAVLKRFRDQLSHTLFGGDKGVGRPDKPLSRRDKDVRFWYMTVARIVCYSLDVLHINLVVAKALRSKADVVVFDRYIYDEFANLLPCRWATQICMQLLLRCTPQPDIAYLLDADPQLARERKPEYPLGFLKRNRESYLTLSKLARMTVISPLSAPEVSMKVIEEIRKRGLPTCSQSNDSLGIEHEYDAQVRAGVER